MSETNEEVVERDDGMEPVDVDPTDILGALDDDEIPADDVEGEGDAEAEDLVAEDGPTGEIEEGAEEEEQVEPEGAEELVTEPPEADEPLVPVLVTHQGREYEVTVTREAAKAIQAQQLTANQFIPLQERYLQLKEQTDTTVPGTTIDEGGQPQFSQEEFERAMKPRVDEAIGGGFMTEGFVSEFPAESAYAVWMFDTMRSMAGALHNVSSSITSDAHSAEVDRFKSGMFGQMGDLAAANPEFCGDLAEQENRESFFEYVVEFGVYDWIQCQ